MCYSVLLCGVESVGVRELRQNASVLLARVAATGESIEITSHGRPVARLVAIGRPERSTRAELIESGLLRPGRGDPLAVVPVEGLSTTTDRLLSDLRDDR